MQVAGTTFWYVPANIIQVWRLHNFYYIVENKKFGGRTDLPAFRTPSYLQPRVPSGTLSE